jgi:hypothetical protein
MESFSEGQELAMQPRRSARVRPSGSMSNAAKIIVDPKSPLIDCKIVDYSASGACVEIWSEIKLPNRFELVFGRTRKRCRLVWAKGRRMGLAF